MSVWRLGQQSPPPLRPVADGVVMRFEGIYEVDPERMQRFSQQEMPSWDTLRIAASRTEHLRWMHEHFADEVLSSGVRSETTPDAHAAGH